MNHSTKLTRYTGKKLGIIGASYLQLPVVLRAKELGTATVCFAWEKGAVCKDFCTVFYPISVVDKREILEAAVSEQIDGVLTIASDVAIPTVSYICENMNLLGNSAESANCSTNKLLMRNKLSKVGMNYPEYVGIPSDADVPDSVALIAESLCYPVIVKPADRSGSIGVTKVMEPTMLQTAIESAMEVSLCGEAVVEEFVQGVEVSVEMISYEGAHYHIAITDKETSGPPHFVELAHHQPSELAKPIQEEIKRQTLMGLEALKIRYGASHAEFLITPLGKVVVTEIAGRMGGDFIGAELVQLSTGYDFLKGSIDIALGSFEPPVFADSPKFAGIYFYSALSTHVLKYIEQGNAIKECVRAELIDSDLKPLRQSADRSCYFLYCSDSKFLLDD